MQRSIKNPFSRVNLRKRITDLMDPKDSAFKLVDPQTAELMLIESQSELILVKAAKLILNVIENPEILLPQTSIYRYYMTGAGCDINDMTKNHNLGKKVEMLKRNCEIFNLFLSITNDDRSEPKVHSLEELSDRYGIPKHDKCSELKTILRDTAEIIRNYIKEILPKDELQILRENFPQYPLRVISSSQPSAIAGRKLSEKEKIDIRTLALCGKSPTEIAKLHKLNPERVEALVSTYNQKIGFAGIPNTVQNQHLTLSDAFMTLSSRESLIVKMHLGIGTAALKYPQIASSPQIIALSEDKIITTARIGEIFLRAMKKLELIGFDREKILKEAANFF